MSYSNIFIEILLFAKIWIEQYCWRSVSNAEALTKKST